MSKPLLIMKFGGTSVGTPEAIERAAHLVAEQATESYVVVIVSAMAQVTNLLYATLEAGAKGDSETLNHTIKLLWQNHSKTCTALLPKSRHLEVLHCMEDIFADFERIANGMLLLREQPLRSVDEAVPTGERLSALLLSEALQEVGKKSIVVSGGEVIVTDSSFGDAKPFIEQTREKAENRLLPVMQDGTIPIITGFNASTEDGVATTLGRGGSDYSASIIAAALKADEIWIWTDVDGILSCDPGIAPDARLLAEVTYNEAAELAYNGAKVLHPRTLAPLAEMEIPVRIKNSFNPLKPGTRISSYPTGHPGPRAITSLAGVSLISIEAAGASMSGAQLMARALEAAARANVEVLLLTRSSFRHNFCMLIRTADVGTVMSRLREELAIELAHGYLRPIAIDNSVGLLAVVGESMRGTPGLAGQLFTAISRQNVNIIAIAQGSSELTIAIVVSESDLRKAVCAIHSECQMGQAGESMTARENS